MTRTHETARDRAERKPDPLARFAGANPVFIVSLIGALAYFVARSAQTSFYSKFGLEPEDVGLGHAETLSRAAGGLLAVTLVVGIIVLAVLRPWRYRPPSERERIGPFARWVSASTIASLVVIALWTPFAYDFKADDVRGGDPVRPPGLSTAYRLVTNPLGLRVTKVHVSWIDEMHAAYEFRGEVMYLGRADGIAVFFDPRNQRTVRVPQSDIVITLSVCKGPKPATIPDVMSRDEGSARRVLNKAGFSVGVQEQDTTDPAQDGIVLSQNPPGCTKAKRGTKVTIVVGKLVETP